MIRVSIFSYIYTVNIFKKMVAKMKQSINASLNEYAEKYDHYRVLTKENRFYAINDKVKTYCSIQIIKCSTPTPTFEIAQSYFEWLNRASKSIIKTTFEKNTYKLYFRFFKKPLLSLTIIKNSETETTFAVSGGMLAKQNQKGTFTFKKVTESDKHYVIALEKFEPSLPWLLYRLTQAPIHEFVMEKFQQEKGLTE